MIRIYEYANCSTCRDALKFLASNRYAVERIDIFSQPPSKAELKKMLEFQNGNIKALFNTTGKVYQEMNLKEKVGKLIPDEAIDLLSKNGKLIKRPFVLTDDAGFVGFKKDAWKTVFGTGSR